MYRKSVTFTEKSLNFTEKSLTFTEKYGVRIGPFAKA